jgi:phosphate:Na+ symporter
MKFFSWLGRGEAPAPAMPLPRLTAAEFENALAATCAQLVEMLRLCRDGFFRMDPKPLQRVKALGEEVHLREKRLTQQVTGQLREAPFSLGTAEQLTAAPAALERVGDAAEGLARCIARRIREDLIFSEDALTEIRTLFDGVTDLVETVGTALTTWNPPLIRHLREDGARLQGQTYCCEAAHEDRLLHGVCVPSSASVYRAMLDNFREIERYTRRLADALDKRAPKV